MEAFFLSIAAFFGAGILALAGILLAVSGGIYVFLAIPTIAAAIGLFIIWGFLVQGEIS